MDEEPAPPREAWGDFSSDLDVQFAFREFGGKTIEEAMPLFAENPIERASELRFTPPAIFNYYVLAFAEAALSPSSRGQADLASCFLKLVRDRALEQPTTLADVWPRLHLAMVTVSEHQSFYDAAVDIYGSFPHLKDQAEAAVREAEEDGP